MTRVAQKSPVHAALYLLLFPQLIAGPIIRYRDIADQLARTDRHARRLRLRRAPIRDRPGEEGADRKRRRRTCATGFSRCRSAQLSAAHAWLGVVCYTLQIYFDFSGYSDMAIGLGRMFGFRFPENFRWPYIAASVQEFWRRWHISLSIVVPRLPLHPARRQPRAARRAATSNLVTVFFLCGLWHGASWNFVLWGLWHGAFLVARAHRRAESGVGAPIRAAARPILGSPLRDDGGDDRLVSSGPTRWTTAASFLAALAGRSPALPAPYTASFYLTTEVWWHSPPESLGRRRGFRHWRGV